MKTENVHRTESQVETDNHQPKVPRAEFFVEHLAKNFRPPIIKTREDAQHGTTEQHIMKVRDNVISVGLLRVRWCNSMGYTRKTADGEQHDQTNCKFHRRGEPQLAAPHGEGPVDDFDTRWHGDRHRRQ